MTVIRGYVLSKSIVNDPLGGKLIRIEIVEEKEIPGPVVAGSDEVVRLAREVLPLVQQFIRAIPMASMLLSNKVPIPRVTIWLSEEEADRLGHVDVGDNVEIVVESYRLEIRRVES